MQWFIAPDLRHALTNPEPCQKYIMTMVLTHGHPMRVQMSFASGALLAAHPGDGVAGEGLCSPCPCPFSWGVWIECNSRFRGKRVAYQCKF
jgi:hypothetical protein